MPAELAAEEVVAVAVTAAEVGAGIAAEAARPAMRGRLSPVLEECMPAGDSAAVAAVLHTHRRQTAVAAVEASAAGLAR
jgi:hypothetical protein